MEIVAAAILGGIAVELFRYVFGKKERDLDQLAKFYPILTMEITRLSHANDRLSSLVEALENEIVFLGGDPDRIRKNVNDGITKQNPDT